MNGARFEWDSRKDLENQEKHGVSFFEAQYAFADSRLTVWEIVHHLIRVLEAGGEGAAAALVTKIGSRAETARELAYHLYTVCERKKRAAEALSYNALVQSWPEISRLAREGGNAGAKQGSLFEEPEA
jgi:putative DNA methylase